MKEYMKARALLPAGNTSGRLGNLMENKNKNAHVQSKSFENIALH